MLLETRGYAVTSALGYQNSLQHCKREGWDLIIVGHSISDRDKRALVEEFRRHCPAPVLALHRVDEPRLGGADYTITPEHPAELLEMVDEIFARAPSVLKNASGRG